MAVKIKTISVRAFRGIPDLELELEGKNLLVRGENGTGKSSIVDAIEFFFTGEVNHLGGVQGLSLQRHGFHTNFKPSDVEVTVIFDPGHICLKRDFTTIPSPPAPLNPYFQIAQKGTFILHRSQILDFITSRPADRYRAIGNILGIEQLDEAELEMMRLRDELEGKVNSLKQQLSGKLQELSSVLAEEVTDIGQIVPILNKMLKKANLPLIKSLDNVDEHAKEMLKSVKKPDALDQTKHLNRIVSLTKVPFVTEENVSELRDLNAKVNNLLRSKAKKQLSFAELLNTGRGIIEQEGLDICPLCEQEIEREKLLIKIGKRIETLQYLSEQSSDLRRLSVPVIERLIKILEELRHISSEINSLPELSEDK